jgi:hypothetical protein
MTLVPKKGRIMDDKEQNRAPLPSQVDPASDDLMTRIAAYAKRVTTSVAPRQTSPSAAPTDPLHPIDPRFGKTGHCLLRVPASVVPGPEGATFVTLSLTVLPDDRIFLAGYVYVPVDNRMHAVCAVVDAEGSIDRSFADNGYAVLPETHKHPQWAIAATAIHVDASRFVYLSDHNAFAHGVPLFKLCVLDTDGRPDMTFAGDGVYKAYEAPVSQEHGLQFMGIADDRLYFAGCRGENGENMRLTVWRLHRDGQLDKAFGEQGYLEFPYGNENGTPPPIGGDMFLAKAGIQKDGKWVFIVDGRSQGEGVGPGTYMTRFMVLEGGLVVFDPEFGNNGSLRIAIQPEAPGDRVIVTSLRMDPALEGWFIAANDGNLPNDDGKSFICRIDGNGRPRSEYGTGRLPGVIYPIPSPGYVSTLYDERFLVDREGRCYLACVPWGGGEAPHRIYRMDSHGQRDASFGAGGMDIERGYVSVDRETRPFALQSGSRLILHRPNVVDPPLNVAPELTRLSPRSSEET